MVDEVIPPAIRAFTPLLGRPHLRSVNGARDSTDRPPGKVSLLFERAIVLPLEGKGDRSAVDEVKMRTGSPSRSVKKRARYYQPRPRSYCQLLTPNSSLLTVFPFVTKKSRISKIPLTDK